MASRIDRGLPPIVHDRLLREDEFAEVWARYEGFVRILAARALARGSLHQAERFAGANGECHHLLASVGAVRRAITGDQDLLADVMQEIAMALVSAIRRSAVRASDLGIKDWFRTVVPRVARDAKRERAVLLFAAGNPPKPEPDGSTASEEDVLPASEQLDLHWLIDSKRTVETARNLFGKVLDRREKAIVEAWLEDREHVDIASALNLTVVNVRVILHRALKAVISAMEARHGPDRPAYLPRCGFVEARCRCALDGIS